MQFKILKNILYIFNLYTAFFAKTGSMVQGHHIGRVGRLKQNHNPDLAKAATNAVMPKHLSFDVDTHPYIIIQNHLKCFIWEIVLISQIEFSIFTNSVQAAQQML